MQIVDGYVTQSWYTLFKSKVIYSLYMLSSFILCRFCFPKLSSLVCRNYKANAYSGKLRSDSRAAHCILRSTKTKLGGLQQFKLKVGNDFQSVLSKIQNLKPSGNSDIQKLKLGLQFSLTFFYVYIYIPPRNFIVVKSNGHCLVPCLLVGNSWFPHHSLCRSVGGGAVVTND